jgi:hypothetical protein
MYESSTLIKQAINHGACRNMQILKSVVEIVLKDFFGGGVSHVRVAQIIAH